MAEEEKFNAKGRAYLAFKLVRQGGQVDINLTRPEAGLYDFEVVCLGLS